jgi:serine/threonine-protein kinase
MGQVGGEGESRSTVSRYLVGAMIGCGGVGDVHACEDVRIGREIAMKRLRSQSDLTADPREAFVREARLQARLEHPAIVPVYDVGGLDDDSTPYFTMKRVRGTTLEQLLAHPERRLFWSLRKLLTAFVQVCLAIDYAHRRGVMHCDLKPGNIMLGSFGEVHVLDWGCARRLVEPLCDGDDDTLLVFSAPLSDRDASTSREVVGTVGYMAPECLLGCAADPSADVYSLGAILFEILAFERLHLGNTSIDIIRSTMRGVESRLSRRRTDGSVPEALDDIVAQALSQDPAARPGSARDLADAVEAYLDGEARRSWERDAAARHAMLARRAADAGQADALRQAARALALDQHNEMAREVLGSLLSRPPEVPPPEASDRLLPSEDGVSSYALRTLVRRLALWAALVPLALSLGVRSWPAAALSIGAIGVAAALATVAQRAGHPCRAWHLALLVVTCGAVATFSGLFGPFVLVPALSATVATSYAMFHGSRDRLVPIALGIAAIVVPLALELCGVLPASLTFAPDGILLLPRMAFFSRWPAMALLVLGNVMTIPVNVLIAGRLSDALADAQRRLAAHAWQLESALPSTSIISRRVPARCTLE